MRYLVAILSSVVIIASAGCKSGKENSGASSGAQPKSATGSATPSSNTATNQANNKPAVRPVNVVNGRVVGVRDALRFVIIDFAGNRMPQLDQRLSVYRLDQKVAEIKISGPYLGTTVAADVTAGEVMLGDFVRDR